MSENPELSAVARSLAQHRKRFEAFTFPATALIARSLGEPRAIIDLASGTGDPALALAAAFPQARVLATDRVPQLLQEAAAEARARQLTNLSTLQADMHSLPLPAASIDAVSSRFGVQFTQDASVVFAEIRRVLAPGAVTCHVVWGAPEQPLLRAMLGDRPKFAAGAPGPFQFSSPGSLTRALTAAEFVEVEEHTDLSDWLWDGDARSFWQFMQETSGGELTQEAEILVAKLSAFERNGKLVFPVEVHCARARKPDSSY